MHPSPTLQAVVVGPSTDRLYRTNLAEVEAGKKERLEALKRETVRKYKDAEEAGQGEFRLHETRNTLDALKEEVCAWCIYISHMNLNALQDTWSYALESLGPWLQVAFVNTQPPSKR